MVAQHITRQELLETLLRGNGVTLVEALPPIYFRKEHLPGASNLPLDDIDDLAPALLADKSAPIVVYCSDITCSNSAIAAARLLDLGYTNVRVYEAGKKDWIEAGLPVESGPGKQRVAGKDFRDRVVLITGGGGGIGKAAARRFLEEGARVALNGRRPEILEAARDELDPSGERVELFAGDASRAETARRFVAAAVERFGGVDVLVNSTGIFRVKPFIEETEDDMEEALDSILRPTFYTSQAAVPEMRKRGGGAIVSVGSMWAVDAIATTPTSAYSAAQAGRHALTKNLAIELAPDRIRVNTVALGFVETPAYERFMSPEQARAVLTAVNSFQPLGRHGYPPDVVEAILFLAGDRAGWITGTTLPIEGGVLAGRSPAGAEMPVARSA
ncbi:MAG: hypothetical protein NVS2B16_13900 [Chloroflexota bacterium]